MATVTGPTSSTDTAIARWNGTTGTVIQDSAITIDSSGNVTGVASLAGSVTTTTQSQGDNSTTIATTAYVDVGLSGLSLGNLSDCIIDYSTSNMFVGQGSGALVAVGTQNTVLGYQSLFALTSGGSNTVVGALALHSADNCQYNIAIGDETLYNATGASNQNTAVGSECLGDMTTGSNNTAFGFNAGQNLVSGNLNIFIGAAVEPPTSSISNYLNIGNAITGDMTTGPALMNGFTATTQSAADNSTKIATTAYVDAAVGATTVVLHGYMSGCLVTNDTGMPNTKVDIAAGTATDSSGASYITSAGYTVDLGSSGAVNKLDTGTLAASSWYHIFVIAKADGTTGGLASLSATSPNLPSGYTIFRRAGSVKTATGAANILAFTASYTGGGTTTQYWNASVLDISTTTLGTSSTSFTLSTPTGVSCEAIMQNYLSTVSIINIRCLDQPDEVPSGTAAPLFTHGQSTAGSNEGGDHIRVKTNTSSQIAMRANLAGTGVKGATLGWLDYRGT